MTSQANGLILDPESELHFTLSAKEETPRCTMNLRHPGTTQEHLAFKVKTTQPRRYLVRPNQGLIGPGATEKVAILLVEKDKQTLLQSFERLGQSALDHAKDKFLVQSCTVDEAFSSRFLESKSKGSDNAELYEALNQMWSSVTGAASSAPIQNKKLHVRLSVKDTGDSSAPTTPSVPTPATEGAEPSAAESMLKGQESTMASFENMSPQQLFTEISNLRKKYDELVSFSVNLTAERDILNNTLEQTKRELQQEMTTRASLENKSGAGATARGLTPDSSSGKKSGGLVGTLLMLLVVGLAAFLGGVREAKTGRMDFLVKVPVVNKVVSPPTPVIEKIEEIVEEDDDDDDDDDDDED